MLDALLQGLGQLSQPQVNAPSRSSWDMPLIPTNFGGPPQRDSITELMNQLYQPQMGMQNAYNQHINAYPEREAPSALRRIGAALYAMGPQRENPLASADQFINYHHYQNLGDWNNKAKNLQMAADNERAQNINERTLAYQTAGRKIQEDTLAETNRKNLESERLREGTLKLQQWKANNPGGKVVFNTSTGKIDLVDPFGKVTPTSIDHGKMDEMSKLNLQADAAMERTVVGQQGAMDRTQAVIGGQADRQQTGAWSVVEVDDPNVPGKKKTVQMNTITGAIRALPAGISGVTKIGTNTAGGDSNLAESRARYVRAQEAKMKPEWAKYVTLGPNNTVTVTPPGWLSGPSADVHKAISDFILGTNAIPNSLMVPQRTGAASSPLTVTPPQQSQSAPVQKPIPGIAGGIAESTDGGRTWKRVK